MAPFLRLCLSLFWRNEQRLPYLYILLRGKWECRTCHAWATGRALVLCLFPGPGLLRGLLVGHEAGLLAEGRDALETVSQALHLPARDQQQPILPHLHPAPGNAFTAYTLQYAHLIYHVSLEHIARATSCHYFKV